MSEIKTDRLGLYGTEHLKCNDRMTLGFKWLTQEVGSKEVSKSPCGKTRADNENTEKSTI